MGHDLPDRLSWVRERTWVDEVGSFSAGEVLRAVSQSLASAEDACRFVDACGRSLDERYQRFEETGPDLRFYRRACVLPSALHVPPALQLIGPPGPERVEAARAAMQAAASQPDDDTPIRQPGTRLVLHHGASQLAEHFDYEGVALSTIWSGDTMGRVYLSDRPLLQATRAVPPEAPVHPLLTHPRIATRPYSAEELAALFVEAIDPEPEANVYAVMPVDVPLGPDGMLFRARDRLRAALWLAGEDAAHSAWLACDGYWGRTWTFADSPEQAIKRLEALCWRDKPGPEPPVEDGIRPEYGHVVLAVMRAGNRRLRRDDAFNVAYLPSRAAREAKHVPLGTMEFWFPGFQSLHAWVSLAPAEMPKVLIKIPPRPEIPSHLRRAGFDAFLGVGASGELHWLFRKLGDAELLVIGPLIADNLDLDEFAAARQPIDRDNSHMMREIMKDERSPAGARRARASRGISVDRYTIWDPKRQRHVPLQGTGGEQEQDRISVATFNADELRWQILSARPE